MYIQVTAASAVLKEPDNLRALDIRVQAQTLSVAPILANAGLDPRIDGDYAWIAVESLRSRGPQHDSTWSAAFDDMIAYADTKGWVTTSDGTRHVRAHIVDESNN